MSSPDSRNNSYFERLTFGGHYQRMWKIYSEQYKVFLTLSAVVLVPSIIIMTILAHFVGESIFSDSKDIDPTDPNATTSFIAVHMHAFLVMSSVSALFSMVFTAVGRGAMIRAVAEMYLGANPDWKACLAMGAKRFCALLCSGFVIVGVIFAMALVPGALFGIAVATKSALLFLLAFIAYVAFFVGYFYVLIAASLVFPAIVIENVSALGGVKRALDLVQNRWCSVFCLTFLIAIANGIVSKILQTIILGSNPWALLTPSGVLVTYVPAIFVLPAITILNTVIYLNLRIDKEGMNVDVVRRDVLSDGLAAYGIVDLDDSGKAYHANLESAKIISNV